MDVNEETFGGSEVYLQEVRGTVTLTRTDSGIWASGTLNALISQICSRCLEEFDEGIALSVEQNFIPEHGESVKLPSTDTEINLEEIFLSKDHTLNIGEIVRQSAIGSRPIKTLCDPDCAGLCCNCGINLNNVECKCFSVISGVNWNALNISGTMAFSNSVLENR